jgi:hypothetical protein
MIRLSLFEEVLRKNPHIFKVQADDIERLCQIANDKCSAQNYNDDSLSTWINLD